MECSQHSREYDSDDSTARSLIIALRGVTCAHMSAPEVDSCFMVCMLTRAQLQISTKPLRVVVEGLHKNIKAQVVNADTDLPATILDKEWPHFFCVPPTEVKPHLTSDTSSTSGESPEAATARCHARSNLRLSSLTISS